MRRTLCRAVSMVFVVGLALIGCDGPNRSQNPSSGSGFTVNVAVTPNTLRGATAATSEAQGGCASVIVKVFDTNGRLIDGAPVSLTTTLGRFPGATGQEFVAVSGTTTRGIFEFPICAKAERGTGTLTANSQDAVATALFTVF